MSDINKASPHDDLRELVERRVRETNGMVAFSQDVAQSILSALLSREAGAATYAAESEGKDDVGARDARNIGAAVGETVAPLTERIESLEGALRSMMRAYKNLCDSIGRRHDCGEYTGAQYWMDKPLYDRALRRTEGDANTRSPIPITEEMVDKALAEYHGKPWLDLAIDNKRIWGQVAIHCDRSAELAARRLGMRAALDRAINGRDG